MSLYKYLHKPLASSSSLRSEMINLQSQIILSMGSRLETHDPYKQAANPHFRLKKHNTVTSILSEGATRPVQVIRCLVVIFPIITIENTSRSLEFFYFCLRKTFSLVTLCLGQFFSVTPVLCNGGSKVS